MKLPPLSRDQVRRVDQVAIDEYGMPGIALMENAGRGAAEIIAAVAPSGPVMIVCGGGNNGGDGYVIARHLQLAGRDVQVVALVPREELNGDARINADIAAAGEIVVHTISDGAQAALLFHSAAVIVDCMLGTGARGALREPVATVVRHANEPDAATRIAIDIPTGLDCDTGVAADPTFRADHTITFVARKLGFEKQNADRWVGAVHEVGIGVPLKLLRQLRDNWPYDPSAS